MNCSTLGLPVHHQLPEFTQTHVHRVHDAIQPSHPLLSPSPPAPSPSQHQSFFQWVNSSHEVAKVLEFQLQHHSFQRIPRADLLQNGLVGSPCSPRDSQESSPTPQFKSINSLALSLLHSLKLTPKTDVIFITGDWNAKVGSQETPRITGKFGLGVQNEARQRLIEFCKQNTLVIANTLFQQHKRRLYTRTSPDGQHWNQVDYILCS